MQFLTACIASLELLQITCGCSTDGPECESSRENEGQDAELGQAARSHLGSRVFLRVSDPANLANRTPAVLQLLEGWLYHPDHFDVAGVRLDVHGVPLSLDELPLDAEGGDGVVDDVLQGGVIGPITRLPVNRARVYPLPISCIKA